MLMPYVVGDDASDLTAGLGWFLKRDTATGNVLFYDAMTNGFDPSVDNEVAGIGIPNYTISSETAAAVRALVDYSVTINPGQTLTLRNGGVILGGRSNPSNPSDSGFIKGGTLRFDNNGSPVEGVFFVNRYDATIYSVVDGTAGITKFGQRALVLAGANTFTGGVQILRVKLAVY